MSDFNQFKPKPDTSSDIPSISGIVPKRKRGQNQDKRGQNQDKNRTNRTLLDTVCVCGKVHKSKDTYYRHRNSGKYNDKTGTAGITIPATSPALSSSSRKQAPAAPVFNSNIIKEINLNGEFKTMSEKINPKKEKKEEYKYECGGCKKEFNNFAEGKTCPFCGIEFE